MATPIQQLPDGRVRYDDGTIGWPQSQAPSITTPEKSTTPVKPTPIEQAKAAGMSDTIIDKINRAFGRVPSTQDILNFQYNPTRFSQQVDTALTTKLAKQNEKIKKDETKVNEENAINDKNIAFADQKKKLHDEINLKTDLTQGEKNILHKIIDDDTYTSGNKVLTDNDLNQLILDAGAGAKKDQDVHFDKVTSEDLQDLKNQAANIRGGFEQYKTQEAIDYKSKLAETKQSLRSRGLTFSGVGRAQLGSQGALEASGVEGLVPEQRRVNYAGKVADYSKQAQTIGITGERQLGSAGIANVNFGSNITTPYGNVDLFKPTGGVTSNLEDQRKKAIYEDKMSRFSSLISNK